MLRFYVSLDDQFRMREAAGPMRNILSLAAAVALLPLAACNSNQPETVDTTAPDPMASQLANATAVELPPSVKASVTFRCQPGNSLVYVDFLSGDKLVNLRTEANGSPIRLTAPEAGQAFTGEGYTVEGTPSAVTYTAPGKDALRCKA